MMKHFLLKLLCYHSYIVRSPLSKTEILRRARNIRSFEHLVRCTDIDNDSFSLYYLGSSGRHVAFSVVAKASIEEQNGETLIHVIIRPRLMNLLVSACLSVFLALFAAIEVGIHLATGFQQLERLDDIIIPFLLLLLIQGLSLFRYRLPAKDLKNTLQSVFSE